MKIMSVFAKGAMVGGTMLVPGVSGGSMAMVLGIYDRLVKAVSNIRKDIKGNILFLLTFILGGGLGAFALAGPMLWLLKTYPKPVLYFFVGCVAGSVPMMIRRSGVKYFTFIQPLFFLAGAGCVVLMWLGKSYVMPASDVPGGAGLVAIGVASAAALVLPGISFSYVLLLVGIYDKTMEAVRNCDIAFLVPLAGGLILGILLVTKILDMAMERFPEQVYMMIIGFVVGSLIETFPGLPSASLLPVCGITLLSGFAVTYKVAANCRLTN